MGELKGILHQTHGYKTAPNSAKFNPVLMTNPMKPFVTNFKTRASGAVAAVSIAHTTVKGAEAFVFALVTDYLQRLQNCSIKIAFCLKKGIVFCFFAHIFEPTKMIL